jgi:CheY-like chemotaxis protein
MTTPLRVLLIEDSENDALAVLRRLRSDGYDVTAERVDTPEAFGAAIYTATWDVIICDYAMPHFNAPTALDLAKRASLDIPFIVVSGKASDEAAVDMLKAGADDYVMKNNLSRLASAIQRELVDAQVRRTHKLATSQLAEHLRLARLRGDVAAAITESADLPSMLRGCTDAMVQHLGAAFARIWTLDADQKVLELQASSGMYTHIDGAHARVPVGQLKIGMIAHERKPHLTNDVPHDSTGPESAEDEWRGSVTLHSRRRQNEVAPGRHSDIVERGQGSPCRLSLGRQ